MKKLFLLVLTAVLLCGCQATDSAPTEAAAPETTPTVVSEEPTETALPAFTFETTDLEGNSWTEACFADRKLTILNFWEPWCGPCVGEMPDLEKISQEYQEQGLLILGIYSTPDADAEVAQVLEDTGVTYPILHYVSNFDFLQTGYVPTTIFVNQDGKILFQPFSGSLGYEDWVQIVEALVK